MPNNFDKLFNQAQGNELINALKGIKSSLDVNYPLETVNVTLSNNAQNITPSENYYGLGQVNVPGMNLSDMTILVNGNYDPVTSGLDGYGKLNVNVPTWSQADEGKVVSNNALVPQTNREVNANGTYDTTLNNSVLVNVPNTYGSEDEGKVVMNNALVPQTNRSITENGTYDTTTNDEVVVDVQGGGSVLVPKTITQNGTYDPTDDSADGYNEVIVNVEGGSGGDIFYDCGEYFGLDEGSVVSSLTISTSGYVGKKAVLIVMHRDDITITLQNWNLVGKYATPTDETYTIAQFISVYERIITNATEIYTISQNTSARMCACLFYLSPSTSLVYDSSIGMDATSNVFKYNIPKKEQYTLCVMSNVYAGQAKTEIDPEIIVNCNSTMDTSNATRRMLAFINPSLTDVILQTNSTTEEASLFCNKLYIFKISIPEDGVKMLIPDYEGAACAFIYYDGNYYSNNAGKVSFFDYYHVLPNHKYVIFVDEPISNRFRAHFYSGKNYADDFEYYVNNNMAMETIYTCTENITGTSELSSNDIKKRFIYTPSTEGEIIILTTSLSIANPPKGYCIELT